MTGSSITTRSVPKLASRQSGKWREDAIGLLALAGMLLVFYPELFRAKSASLLEDHLEQHYVWAKLLAHSVREGTLPWWTPAIQSGFPLVAEGQIGAFYPLNLILYFLLPFPWAYSYMNLVHFFLAGAGTYLYARQMKLGPWAAWTAAFVFLFGAGYGGAYYNITSLKTIAWFPWMLLSCERFIENGRWRSLIPLTASVACSILAGYFQVSVLSLGVFFAYSAFRVSFPRDGSKFSWRVASAGGAALAVAAALGILLALPQIWLTFQLALLSNRLWLGEDYAYVGSMSPAILLTFLFNHMQGFLRGNSVYGGTLSVFLMAVAFHTPQVRMTRRFQIWCWIGGIAFVLGLGEWSPLYVGLVKLTHFYWFRTPAKLIIFVCFAAALLAGMGMDAIGSRSNRLPMAKATRTFYLLVAAGFLSYGVLYYFVSAGRPLATQLGEWFVRAFVFGRAGHPHSLATYEEKLRMAFDSTRGLLAPTNGWNIASFLFAVSSGFWVASLRAIKWPHRVWISGALGLLAIDLYTFSFRDIKRDFDTYEHVSKGLESPVLDRLGTEQAQGKVERILSLPDRGERFPDLVPNVLMLYGLEDVGAYTPLVMGRYHETVGQFGTVNDSNFAFVPGPRFFEDHLNLLGLLGVSHILSRSAMELRDVELVARDGETGIFLYRNRLEHERAFAVSSVEVFSRWVDVKKRFLEPGFQPRRTLLLERSELVKLQSEKLPPRTAARVSAALERLRHAPGFEFWSVHVDSPGFFVLANSFYPGWEARVNGRPAPVLKAYGLFQAVWLGEPGIYEMELRYHPFYFLKVGNPGDRE